ncbi:MAG TPA: hypothetical protein VJU61_25310, partial [Polyangiaceae bacterium]|nr:hypothetical protein [Polyangiaceae bacterium]
MPEKCAVPQRRGWFAGVCLLFGLCFGGEHVAVVHAASPAEHLEPNVAVVTRWQTAAALEDWQGVAQGIDALTARARSEP